MSRKPDPRERPRGPSAAGGSQDTPDDREKAEGWESLAEESDRRLAPNPELEAALREAADAVDRAGRPGRAEQGGEASAQPATEPREGASPEDETERLRRELAEARERILRLHADFDNFRKRALKDRNEALHYAHENLVKDLLPTVDNLDRAIDHARRSGGGDLENLLQGVELVQRDLRGALQKHSITEIEPLGKPFDPTLHEAMAQTPDGSVPPGTVVQVFQKGYQLRDRLIRPARVVVARPPDDAEEGRGGGAAAG